MPKEPVQLNPPKDDPISLDELAAADGMKLPSAVVLIAATLCVIELRLCS